MIGQSTIDPPIIDTGAVYLVDDDASFLRSMTRLLRWEGFRVNSFATAAQFLPEVSPELRGCVVADLDMPDIGGLQLQSLLLAAQVMMPVIFLTGHGDIPSTVRAMRGGAVDFLEKSAGHDELIVAIRLALVRDAAGHEARVRLAKLGRRFALLTNREQEVLEHVVSGMMNKQIAAMLGINERTVKLHRTSITTKVGVHSVAQLATLARELGLFERDTPVRDNGLPLPFACSIRDRTPARTFP